jgi:hypothetical protein
MINQAFSADTCTGITPILPGPGRCCDVTTGVVKGTGVSHCGLIIISASDGNAKDKEPWLCLSGYQYTGSCIPCPLGLTSNDDNSGLCTVKCPVDSYCPIQVATLNALIPIKCPTGSISPLGSDSLEDCNCSDASKTIDMTSLTCLGTYNGGTGCQIYDAGTMDTCIKCRDGFRLSGKTCTACIIPNCITCDTNISAERCLSV